MPNKTAAAIRACVGVPQSDYDRALLAVIDKCEQMRARSAGQTGGVGRFLADEFETVIARELGIER